jgi:Zn-dependent oligopeptidase
MTNPSYYKSTLQYLKQLPFNLIKDADFKPAFSTRLKCNDKEIMAINPAKPTSSTHIEIAGAGLKRATAFTIRIQYQFNLQALQAEYLYILWCTVRNVL